MLHPPSTSLNRHILTILEKCSNFNHLKQLQSHIITLGHAQTHFYAFKLIRFCTINLSNVDYARHLFDKFPSPNIYLYTGMVTSYSSVSDHVSAVVLYRDMVRKNRSKPNHFMFSLILKSWAEVLKRYGVGLVHSQIVKYGFNENSFVQTGLLDAYGRGGANVCAARMVFDEMSERNVVSWTAMISGYLRVGLVEKAVVLFEQIPEGIRDTPIWNCIVAGCLQTGLFSEAIKFFRRMVMEEGVTGGGNKPNQGTIVCVLSAIGHSGILQYGKCIHGYICRNGLSLDMFVVNGLIDMYGKCGCLRESRLLFDLSMHVDLTAWNCLINIYALHGRCHEAIGVFEEMLRCGVDLKPDVVTFVGLLNACTHGGLVKEGRRYYDMMVKEYQVEPRIEHYGCLIDLLGRAGKFEEAMEVVGEMRVPPDEAIWGSLLNGCKIHGRTDLAELAVKKLIEINPNNGGYPAMLANIYGEIGKWEEVWKLRRNVLESNAYKATGCSWIELDKQVRKFNSVDKSHPETEEIYAVLDWVSDTSKLQEAYLHP